MIDAVDVAMVFLTGVGVGYKGNIYKLMCVYEYGVVNMLIFEYVMYLIAAGIFINFVELIYRVVSESDVVTSWKTRVISCLFGLLVDGFFVLAWLLKW